MRIGYFGLTCGVLLFLVLTVWLLAVEIIPNGWDSSKHIDEILSYLMLAVAVIVMAVPEGLPLAVTISLAYSIKQMVKEQCLVRRLACCETMGAVHVICTDKTGTLTQNQMRVTSVWNGHSYDSTCFDTAPFAVRSDADSYKELVYNCIVYNSSAVLHPHRKGLPTELALLEYAQKLNPEQEVARSLKTFLRLPFDSDRKRSTTGVQMADGKKYIFMVGGIEIIMGASNMGFYSIERSLKRSEASKLTY